MPKRTQTLHRPKADNQMKDPTVMLEDHALEMMSSDITELLHQDHLKVLDMFFRYSSLEDNKAKQQLVQDIVKELFVHSTLEEELVYPKVRKEGKEKEEVKTMMDEAETEHHIVKVLMAELSGMKPNDDLYDAKVCTLGELVRHHVREEEKYMFDKMRMSGMDLEELGNKLTKRKQQVIEEYNPELVEDIWDELEEFRS